MVRLRLPAQSWWHVAVVGESLGEVVEVARPTPRHRESDTKISRGTSSSRVTDRALDAGGPSTPAVSFVSRVSWIRAVGPTPVVPVQVSDRVLPLERSERASRHHPGVNVRPIPAGPPAHFPWSLSYPSMCRSSY